MSLTKHEPKYISLVEAKFSTYGTRTLLRLISIVKSYPKTGYLQDDQFYQIAKGDI
jgi:hypothetical protein